ncbi:hypothetical protein VPNG_03838 [Cytospora leucostoma]|uniref:Uncharacterized protein n=1 Tax=Cytospora leucostoma TaxID=1230097 RepID=A0A423XF52_9PEZI|nr:hypothetical protein VPNG_03838 [Cytospora leucostoma]
MPPTSRLATSIYQFTCSLPSIVPRRADLALKCYMSSSSLPHMEGPSREAFPVMRLPREIRDMIWREVVLSPDGHIRVGYTELTELRQQSGAPVDRRAVLDHYNDDPDRIIVKHSQIPEVSRRREPEQYGTYFSPQICHPDWHEFASVANLNLEADCKDFEAPSHPNLSLFYACRQVYEEASEIYYKENNFVFCTCSEPPSWGVVEGPGEGITSVHAALAFLHDRTAHALGHIHKIELHLLDFASIPESPGIIMTSLFELLSSPAMGRIDHLTLDLSGGMPEPAGPPSPAKTSNSLSLIDNLVKLSGVKRLTTRWFNFFCMPRLPLSTMSSDLAGPDLSNLAIDLVRATGFIELIRSSLLDGGSLLGRRHIRGDLISDPFSALVMISSETDDVAGGRSVLPPVHAYTPEASDPSDTTTADNSTHPPPLCVIEADIFRAVEELDPAEYLRLLDRVTDKEVGRV